LILGLILGVNPPAVIPWRDHEIPQLPIPPVFVAGLALGSSRTIPHRDVPTTPVGRNGRINADRGDEPARPQTCALAISGEQGHDGPDRLLGRAAPVVSSGKKIRRCIFPYHGPARQSPATPDLLASPLPRLELIGNAFVWSCGQARTKASDSLCRGPLALLERCPRPGRHKSSAKPDIGSSQRSRVGTKSDSIERDETNMIAS